MGCRECNDVPSGSGAIGFECKQADLWGQEHQKITKMKYSEHIFNNQHMRKVHHVKKKEPMNIQKDYYIHLYRHREKLIKEKTMKISITSLQ
jgi:hypothetical protein